MRATAHLLTIIFLWINCCGLLLSQQTERKTIRGTVVEQRKYSVVLQTGTERMELAIPDRVPIAMRLDRPELDLNSNLLTQELTGASATDGNGDQPLKLKQSIPNPLGVFVEFAHENERKRLMSGPVKRLVRYQLIAWDEAQAANNSSLSFLAKVEAINERGILSLELDGEHIQAELGNRDGQLGGRTIIDLKPFEAEVEAEADLLNDRWVAQSVTYRQVIDPLLMETPGLPRVLVIGDEVSLSYLRALRKKLAGEFNVAHPPENCRGSANWERMDLWLGPHGLPGRQWNVIVLNCGLADLETDETKYAQILEQSFQRLETLDAQIIWVSTSPLPENWEASGLSRTDAQKKIEQLNQISRRVSAKYGRLRECDLWQFVTTETKTRLANWSKGRSAAFSPAHSEIIAEALATKIRESK